MWQVSWRLDDGRQAERSDLRPAPEVNSGFTEMRSYRFICSAEGASFLIDDERLLPAVGGEWKWTPGFYAGSVTAELRDPADRVIERFVLDVSPDPTKLGRDVFERMVQELLSELPELLLGEEPATTLVGELGVSESPLLALARLRAYVPQFLAAIKPIQRRPRRTLRVTRTSAALHQVRRIDRRTVLALSRSSAGALLAEPFDVTDFDPAMRLDVPAIEDSLDAAANRALMALLQALIRRVRSVEARLAWSVAAERDSETRTSLADRWPVRQALLRQLEIRLAAVMRGTPFRSVKRADVTAAGLNAISADPDYSRAWGRGWRALKHGVEGDPSHRAWITPSWEVYEGWCFLQLGRQLRETFPDWDWCLKRSIAPVWVGKSGLKRAELAAQARFPAYPNDRTRRWSVSRRRKPDIVLTVTGPDGARFVVFDAKYRVSRKNVLDAMASAHIYRDALRLADVSPEAAFLIVPEGGGAPWLQDPDFHSLHGVGVLTMSPGRSPHLPESVRALLEAAS